MAELSDRAVEVLAMLLVDDQFDRGGSLATYAPFVRHCLSRCQDDVVSAPDLQRSLRAEWGIKLPQGVITEVLRRLEGEEKVEISGGVFRIVHENLIGDDLGGVRAEVERQRAELLDGIRTFAKEHFELEWSESDADAALHKYSDAFSSRVLAAALTGESIQSGPPDTDSDRYVIHRFAAHVFHRNSKLFEDLVVRVKGRMLADRMYYVREGHQEVPSLEKVEVYLDGPILLFVLGYAGPEIQGQYTEMLEMLRKQAAVVRCFTHSLTEAREILDAAAYKARTGQGGHESFHGDVIAHLVRSDRSPTEIEVLSNRLPNDLLQLGINPVETPARKERLQSDEEELDRRLEKALKYSHKTARERDIDSLTAIYRLRDGKSTRDFAACRAIFVTHNFTLFAIATRFFRGDDRRAVSPAAHDAAFTTLLWLREPLSVPDLPRDRIIADAYSALNPKPDLWLRYNEEIDRLRVEGGLDEADVVFLRYGREAQEALMDETRGDPEAFTGGTVAQVLRQSREVEEEKAERRIREAEGKADRATSQLDRSRGRVQDAARMTGDLISLAALAAATILVLVGMIYGPVGPVQEPFISGVVQLISTVVFLAATLTTMFFRPSLIEYRSAVSDWVAMKLESAGLRLLGLDGGPNNGDAVDAPRSDN